MSVDTCIAPVTVAGDGELQYLRIGQRPYVLDYPMGREINLRNVGMNTLHVSTDDTVYFDVACGTSFDIRVKFKKVWLRTEIGETYVYILVTN